MIAPSKVSKRDLFHEKLQLAKRFVVNQLVMRMKQRKERAQQDATHDDKASDVEDQTNSSSECSSNVATSRHDNLKCTISGENSSDPISSVLRSQPSPKSPPLGENITYSVNKYETSSKLDEVIIDIAISGFSLGDAINQTLSLASGDEKQLSFN
jgi:hypothetical protein